MSTTTLRALERDLLDSLAGRLSRHGFSSRPKAQVFLRPISGGRAAIHLSFIEHDQDFDATADVAVRFDAVEELVNEFNPFISKSEKAGTYTLGVELGNLETARPYRVRVAGSDDIERAADQLATKIEKIGLPYLDRFAQPEAAYELLVRDDREAWLHSPIHAGRAKRACALLAVLGRRSEIPEVAARKLAFLQSIEDRQIAEFSSFLTGLTR